MRTYGRDINGNWETITDTNLVWVATLTQTLRLVRGESPFYAGYGIPAQQSVNSQIPPDAAVATTQSQYAPYFTSLTVSKDSTAIEPTYNIRAVLLNGTPLTQNVVAT